MDAVDYVRSRSKPMTPLATGVEPKLGTLPGIRLVAFDLYGTLLISGSGDVGMEIDDRAETGMRAAWDEMVLEMPGSAHELEGRFREILETHRDAKLGPDNDHPEVDIREVWRELVEVVAGEDPGNDAIERAVLAHQCLVNPCWGMPEAAPLVQTVADAGIALGIISNAQFYTAPVCEALLSLSIDGLPFDPGYTFLSYLESIGKPSVRLHEKLKAAAEERGIRPDEIFYLGNDWRKDVLPANAMGFRSGLFAGDARSLRLPGEGIEYATKGADVVLTDLDQLRDCLALR